MKVALARGAELEQAARQAKAYVTRILHEAVELGARGVHGLGFGARL